MKPAAKIVEAIISNDDYYKQLNEKELKKFIVYASDMYYNDQPIISDAKFDEIMDHLKKIDNNFEVIGAPVHGKKTKLPVWMGSMNKKKMNDLKSKYANVVITDKLDGVSCLYTRKQNKINLYTRGNGKHGSDITHLLSYFNNIDESKGEDVVIRGELIMKRKIFEKLKTTESNPRNTVSGFVNSKDPNTKFNKMIDFVVYEVIKPKNKLSVQLESLNKTAFETVFYKKYDNISSEEIHNTLVERRNKSDYDIDGIIITLDEEYEHISSGNPKHAFAYKHNFDDKKVESVVKKVSWNVSKDGFLKPTVYFEEVSIDNVKISAATGFNAKFIMDNKIGKGTIVVIERSGDVIPHIVAVKKATVADMPSVEYTWNKSKIDIIVSSDNTEKLFQNLIEKLKIEGFGKSRINQFYKKGWVKLNTIYNLSVQDIKSLDGFSDVSAGKLHKNIQKTRNEVKCIDYMQASNAFGRGFSTKRLELILKTAPTLSVSNLNVENLEKIDGIGKILAEQYIVGVGKFNEFLKDNKIECEIKMEPKQPTQEKINSLLLNKKVLFTGFRDASLAKEIESLGGVVDSTMTKLTNILVVKSKEKSSSKLEKATKQGTEIMTIEEFKNKYIK
jgi:DNA ligase (NAD+)